MNQTIHIHGLRLRCHVGVPDEEIAHEQELLLHVEMSPRQAWDELNDDIQRTVDYAAVVAQLEELARVKPRRLIETLAVDCVDFLLRHHPLTRVKVTIEKFILPQTRAVAVVLEKSR
jgi:7,8-dihydroneopterin aldolase/epimerase/oxygenase